MKDNMAIMLKDILSKLDSINGDLFVVGQFNGQETGIINGIFINDNKLVIDTSIDTMIVPENAEVIYSCTEIKE